MTSRLEAVYLANVLLFIKDMNALRAFPLVSKSCQVAMLTLKTNPAVLSHSPRDILRFFPDINTMVVNDLSSVERLPALPDTVTAVIVQRMDFDVLPRTLRYADRVVEIRDGCAKNWPADFTRFPNLQKLRIVSPTNTPIAPRHKLKRVTVFRSLLFPNPLRVFPPDCAEQIAVIFPTRKAFAEAKAQHPPPPVRLFCTEIGEGVGPDEFFPEPSFSATIPLADTFGADSLRVLIERSLLSFKRVVLEVPSQRPACDVSFLTSVTHLEVRHLQECALTIPTSVVRLELGDNTNRVAVSGTEGLTSLDVPNQSVTTAPCPRLQTLQWKGAALSERTLPFPLGDATALSHVDAEVSTIDLTFRFPATLTSLQLKARDGSVNGPHLTPLTRLQRLDLNVSKASHPLDLSGLTALTWLNACELPVARLPASLVTCFVALQLDADLSPLTRLHTLYATATPGVSVTFPVGLKELHINTTELRDTNLADVALELFDLWGGTLTPPDLEKLPRTLWRIVGKFAPESLQFDLRTLFPRLLF